MSNPYVRGFCIYLGMLCINSCVLIAPSHSSIINGIIIAIIIASATADSTRHPPSKYLSVLSILSSKSAKINKNI